jgi:hypothetical protein
MKKIMLLLCFIMVASVLHVHAAEKRFSVPIADSPALGPADAPVTIIEFLDFQ